MPESINQVATDYICGASTFEQYRERIMQSMVDSWLDMSFEDCGMLTHCYTGIKLMECGRYREEEVKLHIESFLNIMGSIGSVIRKIQED